ncbi:MAG: hypothetical protein LAT58_01995 [Opitutales bacterium]|nr:hypothetical protein [Opitutales bacterium]
MAGLASADTPDSFPGGRLTLQGLTVGPVTKLSGFQKERGHQVPKVSDEAAQAFVQTIGEEEVRNHADLVFQRLRREFALRRRDFDLQLSKGAVRISLPGSRLDVWIELQGERSGNYELRTEISGEKLLEEALIPQWVQVLEGICSELIWQPNRPIKVEKVIDRLEEDARLRPHLDYPLDGSFLTLVCPDPLVIWEVRADRVTFRIPAGGDLRSLLEGSQRLLPLLGNQISSPDGFSQT